jgi:hypothetical protein
MPPAPQTSYFLDFAWWMYGNALWQWEQQQYAAAILLSQVAVEMGARNAFIALLVRHHGPVDDAFIESEVPDFSFMKVGTRRLWTALTEESVTAEPKRCGGTTTRTSSAAIESPTASLGATRTAAVTPTTHGLRRARSSPGSTRRCSGSTPAQLLHRRRDYSNVLSRWRTGLRAPDVEFSRAPGSGESSSRSASPATEVPTARGQASTGTRLLLRELLQLASRARVCGR